MRSSTPTFIILFYLLNACAVFGGEKTARVASVEKQFELVLTAPMRDSLCGAISENNNYRPVILVKSKESMKRQLVKLVNLTNKNPIQYNLSFQEVLWELERLPDEKQLEMVALAAIGGATKKALQRVRKELTKHKIHQFAPSLEGAKLNVDLPLLPAKVMLQLDISRNATVQSTMLKGRLSATLRQTKHYVQQRLDLKLFTGMYVIGMRTFYPRLEYRSAGLSIRRRGFKFYYLYQKNVQFENRDRMIFQCHIDLNKVELN